jgi:hypothetical protein
MSGVNYRYTVIVRVSRFRFRVEGGWVGSVVARGAVVAVTPSLMVAVDSYSSEASFSFGRVVDAECFSPEGQALSMQS